MIDLSHLPLASAAARPPGEEDGAIRLWNDLLVSRAPAELRARILRQIDAEPPRVETDAKGGVVAINPAFTVLCGYTFQEVRGRKPGSVLQGADSDPRAVATLRRAIEQAEACEVEIVNYHKDGSPYRVRIEMEPICDEDGALSGFRATEIKLPLA